MLPDLPEFKGILYSALVRYVGKRAHAQLGVFAEVPRHIIHEGRSTRVSRANGELEDSSLMQASAQSSIPEDAAVRLSHQERMNILNALADELARDMATELYGALNDSLDKVGQTVDNKGKPFDAEAIFSMLEIIEIDFDRNEQPKLPTISIAPQSREAVRLAFEQIENDPKLRVRYANMMGEKKAKWRDREAARKLVG